MSAPSVFADEWRRCLREQYKQTVRTGNAQQRADITNVLFDAGFAEEALCTLYLEATMRADDLPPDFVPDLDMLETWRREERADHARECTCPICRPPA